GRFPPGFRSFSVVAHPAVRYPDPVGNLGAGTNLVDVIRQIFGDGFGLVEITQSSVEFSGFELLPASQEVSVDPVLSYVQRTAFPHGKPPAAHELDSSVIFAGED